MFTILDMHDSNYNGIDHLMTAPDVADKPGGVRRFQAIKEHLYSDLKDEAVILSIEAGRYYGLNAVGVSIWKAIQEPATLEEIEAVVMAEYDVEPERCHVEVLTFLTKMADEKLIGVFNEESD